MSSSLRDKGKRCLEQRQRRLRASNRARLFSHRGARKAARGGHTLSEVAQSGGLSCATARRILATLVVLKYCTSDGRYFSLRPRAFGLGMSYLNALPWAHALRALENLRNELGESGAMAVLDEDEIVYALRLPARRICLLLSPSGG